MRWTIGALTVSVLSLALLFGQVRSDPLSSWTEGPAKKAITSFVARVTKQDGPDFVRPGERIAVFDNDGTLWAEQPLYFQFQFAMDRVNALASQNPQWKSKEPFASLLNGDVRGAWGGGEEAIAEIIAATHAGMTTEEFEKTAKDWLSTARHPRTKEPYTRMVYQPMLELLGYLRANGFKTFIVTGGGVEFIRVFSEGVYGIPPEQIVGSTGRQEFDISDGKPVIVKLPEVDFVDDGPGKPVGIQRFIGRRPIAAFGNSDGDLQMLQWTCSAPGARLCMFVHHTDAEREWAYDRSSQVGKLDKGLDAAATQQWVVVDMKANWKKVFPSR
jgi:phosphoglycolate phosphatase-like HAD superfamily hydrolase